ncbi:ras-like protein [Anaeramoeba ignava]|uniref:Ras-like protein n=1 Tax=Anaeramoeba ignava TaxID=1746090 RepID=A0A9Q0LI31_ANAIG|nr:ras-like protein [Anaeramoeba ignava]
MSQDKIIIVLVGSGSVGKSCTALRYIQSKFVEDYDPTIEESYRKMVIVDQIATMLEVIDTAGQEEYRSVRDKNLKIGDGFLVVYSIISTESFLQISSLHQAISQIKSSKNFPTVTTGNKLDLEKQREVPKKDGEKIAEKFSSSFIEISAKTGQFVNDAFEELIRKIRKFKESESNNHNRINTNTSQKQKKKRLRCSIL